MLLENAAVLERHQPAGELDHPRSESGVPVGERCRKGHVVSLNHRDRPPLVVRCASAAWDVADGRSDQTAALGSLVAASATSDRSVSKESRLAASSKETHRTSSNSWSWFSRLPPVGSIMK